jgi:hypothetical protein
MKKIILMLSVLVIGFLPNVFSAAHTIRTASNREYSDYGKKRSRWCNLMRASSFKNPAKFQQYVA